MSLSYQYDLLPIRAFARSNGDLVFVQDNIVIVLSPRNPQAGSRSAEFAADIRGVYEVPNPGCVEA